MFYLWKERERGKENESQKQTDIAREKERVSKGNRTNDTVFTFRRRINFDQHIMFLS